jgi:hypothetical protein
MEKEERCTEPRALGIQPEKEGMWIGERDPRTAITRSSAASVLICIASLSCSYPSSRFSSSTRFSIRSASLLIWRSLCTHHVSVQFCDAAKRSSASRPTLTLLLGNLPEPLTDSQRHPISPECDRVTLMSTFLSPHVMMPSQDASRLSINRNSGRFLCGLPPIWGSMERVSSLVKQKSYWR